MTEEQTERFLENHTSSLQNELYGRGQQYAVDANAETKFVPWSRRRIFRIVHHVKNRRWEKTQKSSEESRGAIAVDKPFASPCFSTVIFKVAM